MYRAFGLSFESALPLPEAAPTTGDAPDTLRVVVRFGAVPQTLSAPSADGLLYQINAAQMIYAVPRVARYLISGGSEIVIQPEENADEDAIRLFLWGAVMGGLLHQRGMFPLRASCIETPRGAVLLAGDSGSGKSTLAARLFQLGCRVLADEITVIQLGSDGSLIALPEGSHLRLWHHALHQLGYSGTFQRVRADLQKYAFPLGAGFCDQPLPLYAIYVLSFAQKDRLAEPISGVAKMLTLNRSIYRQRFGIDMHRLQSYWNVEARIARDVPMTLLRRVAEQFDLDAPAAFVREHSR